MSRKGDDRLMMRRLKLAAIGGFAAAAVFATVALAFQLTWPNAWSGPATAAVHAARAEEALAASPRKLAVARAETLKILDQGPLNAAAWAQIAYIQRADEAALDDTSLGALDRSYDAAPYGPEVSAWRVRFVYEHWLELPPPLRAKAIAELKTFSKYRSWIALPVIRSIHNPTGRLAARMTFDLGKNAGIAERKTLVGGE